MDLTKLSKEEKIELLIALEEQDRRKRENKLFTLFPEDGDFARKFYPKAMQFFEAGSKFKERALFGGNRVGKTMNGGTELTYHATGLYPDWWKGRRFNQAINAVAAGKTNNTTRDIIQDLLIGKRTDVGTGLIPKDCIVKVTTRPGVPDAIQDIYIKHVSGGTSQIVLKSYEQGRGSFEGTAQHVIWFDEEPDDPSLYSEALMRTGTTNGIMMSTFTPLLGISDVVMSFMPGGMLPDNGSVNEFKFAILIGWDDIPAAQLPLQEREAMLQAALPHEKEARSKGIPSIGEGKIYPIEEDAVLVDPFHIPRDWPKAYALDPGWHRTAVVWGAIDPNTDTVYIYDEYYRGQSEPAVHCAAIRARGSWMNGAFDYASNNRNEGKTTRMQFEEQGLKLYDANKSVDAGILCVYRALSEGRLKVFRNLSNWIKEFRIYRYDKHGKVHKEHDHLMDATRYWMMTAIQLADVQPDLDDMEFAVSESRTDSNVSEITGY